MHSPPCCSHLLQHSLKALILWVKKSLVTVPASYAPPPLLPHLIWSGIHMECLVGTKRGDNLLVSPSCSYCVRGTEHILSSFLDFVCLTQSLSCTEFSVVPNQHFSSSPLQLHYLWSGDFFEWDQLLFHIINFIQCFHFSFEWPLYIHFFGGMKYMKWCMESFIP
jgi:hypothetical protein